MPEPETQTLDMGEGALEWFSAHMKEALRDNAHKGGWENCDVDWLLARLIQETGELAEAMAHPRLDSEAVISEAADVANFAMMIADVARKAGLGEE